MSLGHLRGPAALTLVGLLGLTACTGSSPRNTAASPSAPPVVTESPSPTDSASPSATPSPSPTTTPAPVGTPACGTAFLNVTYAPTSAGAGSAFGALAFTNRGSRSCTLFGFPGVAFVTGANHQQVGAPATRTAGSTEQQVYLPPGGVAHAQVRMSNAFLYPEAECRPVPVDALRVYPPNQTVDVIVPLPQGTNACSATHLAGGPQLGVAPVTQG